MKVSNTMKALGLLSTKLEKPITVNVIATFDHKEQEFFDLDLPTKEIVDNEDLIIKFIIFAMRVDPKDRLVKLSLSFKGDLDFLDQFQGIKNSINNNGKYYFNVEINEPNNIEENILEYLRQINSFLSFNLPLKKVHETAFEQEVMKAIR
tara:strand:- start:329 stop:778 length:450 start_codon:yes stop_codon:yes gene_type:complete